MNVLHTCRRVIVSSQFNWWPSPDFWQFSDRVITYRSQHCLEWVVRVYSSKLTPDNVVTYLFHDWTQLVIVLPSVARACDDQSTVHLDWQLRDYQYSRVRNVWWINRVLLRILIWFSYQFAGFHVANRAVTLLLLLCRCMKYFRVFL